MLGKIAVNHKLLNCRCKGSGFLREVLYIADIKEVTSVAVNMRSKPQSKPYKGSCNIHTIHTLRCERILRNTINIYRNAGILHRLRELETDISYKGGDGIDSSNTCKVCKS